MLDPTILLQSSDTTDALSEIEHSGYINISEIMEERCKLIGKLLHCQYLITFNLQAAAFRY